MNPRLVRLLTTTGITAFVAVGMSGCFLGDNQNQDVRYGVADQVRTLVIEGHTGDVRVTGGGTTVQVTEHQNYRDKPPSTTHEVTGGTLTLTYSCSDCGVGYDVQVPAGTVVRVKEDTGTVRLTGLTAEVRADTRTGDLDASQLGSASVELSSQTGNVTAAFTVGPQHVQAVTQTGDVKISLPQGPGYAVRADTHTGDVKVSVPQQSDAARTITATAQTGNVTVTGA
ncbi:DUF4097 family beta strand repeat-containing protein [Kitasatospora mediocidica]|uniref:DUF4097 family beta strand repeat-containing protein n=1 Tax=Kitasatospora mediocidica TaxID=58352 RepID=UPI00056C89F3|nr:DUF4097 family beta strand repeat-containing protein [Kitasatospora mediocidica]